MTPKQSKPKEIREKISRILWSFVYGDKNEDKAIDQILSLYKKFRKI